MYNVRLYLHPPVYIYSVPILELEYIKALDKQKVYYDEYGTHLLVSVAQLEEHDST